MDNLLHRDFINNGIATFPVKVSSYDDVINPLSVRRYETPNPDVIFVTVAYRLGALGFLHLSHLPDGEDYPDAQNVALLDQTTRVRKAGGSDDVLGRAPRERLVQAGLLTRGVASPGSVYMIFNICKKASGFAQHAN